MKLTNYLATTTRIPAAIVVAIHKADPPIIITFANRQAIERLGIKTGSVVKCSGVANDQKFGGKYQVRTIDGNEVILRTLL